MNDPYSRFRSLRTFLVISGLTFTFGGTQYFHDQLPARREELVEFLVMIVYALVPFLVWAFVVYVVLPLVLEKAFFRRFVLGRRYIEGTWFQWANEPAAKKGLSILEIQPNHDSFVVMGTHYVVGEDHLDDIGKPVTMEPIKFEWPTLLYYYSTTPIVRKGESDDSEGVGRMLFPPHGEATKRFAGTYSYAGLRGTAVVEGRRATAEEIKDLQQSDRRPALMRKLVLEFPKLSGTSDRSIAAGEDGPSHPPTGP